MIFVNENIRVPVIDLFSGAGGLSLGLKNSGMNVVAAVEIDQNACDTYATNIGNVVLNKDISEISGMELLDFAGLNQGDFFVLAGCPPCQGFSSIGLKNKSDVRNQLAFQFIRLIHETKPSFIIMENVPGMSKGIGKEIFHNICEELNKDYLIEYDILNSANYGVPQQRKRLVLHGVRKDIKELYFPTDYEISLPVPTHIDPLKNNEGLLQNWNTVSMIKGLPEIKAGESYDGIYNHVCRKLSELNLKRISLTPHNGGSRKDWPNELVLECHKRSVGYTDVYGRMSFESVAPTITAGCLSYSKGRFGHPIQNRAISAREAARLQTFPDDFKFCGNIDQVARQIGNAVPPLLAEASGRHIVEEINKYNLL